MDDPRSRSGVDILLGGFSGVPVSERIGFWHRQGFGPPRSTGNVATMPSTDAPSFPDRCSFDIPKKKKTITSVKPGGKPGRDPTHHTRSTHPAFIFICPQCTFLQHLPDRPGVLNIIPPPQKFNDFRVLPVP